MPYAMLAGSLPPAKIGAVMIGGGFLALAALLAQFVRDIPADPEQLIEGEGVLPTMTPPESPLAEV
ncbi:MAG: hypothetical protein ABI787_03980 [Spartobacteria bacterium]